MACYEENSDMGYAQILDFVSYMVNHRSGSFTLSQIYPEDYHRDSTDGTDGTHDTEDQLFTNIFIPLNQSEDLPTILFHRTGLVELPLSNYSLKQPTPLLVRYETGRFCHLTGKNYIPVINLENELNAYYKAGLREGCHHYLHTFAIKFDLAIRLGFKINTDLNSDGTRWFRITKETTEDCTEYEQNNYCTFYCEP